jgi:Protein of unknown function (DUF2846)
LIEMSHPTKVLGSTLVVMILAMPAIAQNTSATVEKACGPEKTQFDVKRAKSQHPLRETEPGKARVYFIQDLGIATCVNCVTVRIGLDGAWVGANQRNSYFSLSVAPGEHHLCAIPQESHLQRLVGLAHFTAEAGKTYYFRARMIGEQNQAVFDFGPIDSDQAEYFIDSYPLSVSYPKGREGEK